MKGHVFVTSTSVGGPVILLNDSSPELKSLSGLAYYKWTHKPFSKSKLVERTVHTNTPRVGLGGKQNITYDGDGGLLIETLLSLSQ